MGNEVSRPPTPTAPLEAEPPAKNALSPKPPLPPASTKPRNANSRVRRRARGGSVTYNLRLVIRGARGTGKTSLYQRLRGRPIPEEHQSTNQLQSATVKWQLDTTTEENVRCEIWDVVDKGWLVTDDDKNESPTQGRKSSDSVEEETTLHGGSGLQTSAIQSAISGKDTASGSHSVAVADASTINVYAEAQGAIFLIDVSRKSTLEYVARELSNVPHDIPTLVLGNFRDYDSSQRQVFKQDVEEVLYANSANSQSMPKRPEELLYFECSLKNCYGLQSLYQYFGIPFLHLKQKMLRQQLQTVEKKTLELKESLQTRIQNQKYGEYMEQLQRDHADIRTGRQRHRSSSGNSKEESAPKEEEEAAPLSDAKEQVEDLPERKPSALKMSHTEDDTATATEDSNKVKDVSSGNKKEVKDTPIVKGNGVKETDSKIAIEVEKVAEKSESSEMSTGTSMGLEDFRVPAKFMNDLDAFYSEAAEESSESEHENGKDSEEEVVVITRKNSGRSAGRAVHKQQMIDSSDSEEDVAKPVSPKRRSAVKKKQRARPKKNASSGSIKSDAAHDKEIERQVEAFASSTSSQSKLKETGNVAHDNVERKEPQEEAQPVVDFKSKTSEKPFTLSKEGELASSQSADKFPPSKSIEKKVEEPGMPRYKDTLPPFESIEKKEETSAPTVQSSAESGNDLEAFLNAGDSDDDSAPLASKIAAPMHVEELAESDDSDAGGYLEYRRQHNKDGLKEQQQALQKMARSISDSKTSHEAEETDSSPVNLNDDILASIRRAQEEMSQQYDATASNSSGKKKHRKKKSHKKKRNKE